MSNFFKNFTFGSPREPEPQSPVHVGSWKAPSKGPGKIVTEVRDSTPSSPAPTGDSSSISSLKRPQSQLTSSSDQQSNSARSNNTNSNQYHDSTSASRTLSISDFRVVPLTSSGGDHEEVVTEEILLARKFEDTLGLNLEETSSAFQLHEVDLDRLKAQCWNGIPSQHRATCWQLLLGYMPSGRDRRASTILDKRQQYWEIARQLWHDVDRTDLPEYERETLSQIKKDVNRTLRCYPLFQSEEVLESLRRILYIWSMRHPASGYVQGINDLATPFICVFLQEYVTCDVLEVADMKSEKMEQAIKEVEADVFWCLSTFIDLIQDNYVPQTPGIQRMLFLLSELVAKLPSLENTRAHFEAQGMQYILFAFRWMSCLLMREVPLKLVSRIWDTYFSEGEAFAVLHVYVCAALLDRFKEKLVTLEFSQLLIFLQDLPTSQWTANDIQLLLSQAYVWRNAYHDSKGHLKSSQNVY